MTAGITWVSITAAAWPPAAARCRATWPYMRSIASTLARAASSTLMACSASRHRLSNRRRQPPYSHRGCLDVAPFSSLVQGSFASSVIVGGVRVGLPGQCLQKHRQKQLLHDRSRLVWSVRRKQREKTRLKKRMNRKFGTPRWPAFMARPGWGGMTHPLAPICVTLGCPFPQVGIRQFVLVHSWNSHQQQSNAFF